MTWGAGIINLQFFKLKTAQKPKKNGKCDPGREKSMQAWNDRIDL
jgi:hypothetical protein